MTAERKFDYARPYDVMVGVWTGMSIVYDAKGRYQISVPSLVAMYWHRPDKVLHYRQDELPDLDERLEGHPQQAAIAKIVHHNFDLTISDKSCQGASKKEDLRVEGTESQPGIYLFHLMFEEGDYYNNQYFTGPNERHIIGPFVAADSKPRASRRGKIEAVVAQTFARVSYDVPSRYKRSL